MEVSRTSLTLATLTEPNVPNQYSLHKWMTNEYGSKASLGKQRTSLGGVLTVTTEHAHSLAFFPPHLLKFPLSKSASPPLPKQEAREVAS